MKKVSLILAILVLVSMQNINIVFASGTVLPGGSKSASAYLDEAQCKSAVEAWIQEYEKKGLNGLPETISVEDYDTTSDDMLSCAIKSGYIKFWMVPFFIRNIMQWLISIAGLISLLMTMVGAYYYIYGSLTDDKDKGKTIIKYALGGLILTTLAWVIVNVILLAITS